MMSILLSLAVASGSVPLPGEYDPLFVEGVNTDRASVRADSTDVCRGQFECIEDHVTVRNLMESQWRSSGLTETMRYQLVTSIRQATVGGKTNWRLARSLYLQQPDKRETIDPYSPPSHAHANSTTYRCDTYVTRGGLSVETTCGKR